MKVEVVIGHKWMDLKNEMNGSSSLLSKNAKRTMLSLAFVYLPVLLWKCDAAKFPSNWTSCPKGLNHNECLKRSIQQAVPDLVKGLPHLGVNPVDPLVFTKIVIEQGNGPVSIDLDFTDMEIRGISNVRVDQVSNDWKTMVVNVSGDVLKINSKYKVNGKVLILPVRGEGNCWLEVRNYSSTITLNFAEKKIGKKTYYDVKDLRLTLNTNPLRLNFENLFDGNKQLGDHFNKFINENWSEIFNELKPAIEEALRQASMDMATRFFNKVPKIEITPN